MPGDLTIQPSSPLPPVQPTPQDTKLPAMAAPPVGPALAAVVPQIPSIALDPEKGIVVIDFRNDAGTIVNSIPSARQLAAYTANQSPMPVTPAPASAETTTTPQGSPQSAPDSSQPPPRR